MEKRLTPAIVSSLPIGSLVENPEGLYRITDICDDGYSFYADEVTFDEDDQLIILNEGIYFVRADYPRMRTM